MQDLCTCAPLGDHLLLIKWKLPPSLSSAAHDNAREVLFGRGLEVLLLSVEQCVLHKEGSRPDAQRFVVSNTTSSREAR